MEKKWLFWFIFIFRLCLFLSMFLKGMPFQIQTICRWINLYIFFGKITSSIILESTAIQIICHFYVYTLIYLRISFVIEVVDFISKSLGTISTCQTTPLFLPFEAIELPAFNPIKLIRKLFDCNLLCKQKSCNRSFNAKANLFPRTFVLAENKSPSRQKKNSF